jgi:hypothetical protein
MAIEKSPLSGIIKAHFESLRAQTIKVPEWGETEITFDPLTIAERDSISKATGNEFMVEAIILKAKDENGKNLFTRADKLTLMNNAAPATITRIALAILSADSKEIDSLKKPSAGQTDPA